MKNLFCSKEKHVVKIGCKNPREVLTDHTTLVGKLYGGKHISLQDLADEVHRCWQIKGETKIEVISKGIYKMVFAEVEDYQHVKTNGPWVIQGFILSIKKVDDLGSMGEDRSFDRVDFWVQIFGLPRDRINEKNVHTVGSTLGKVKGMDLHCSAAFKNPVARVRVRSPKDIKNNFSFGLRANVFYNGDAVPIPASITFSGPPQKPRMDQIPARNRTPPGKKLWKGDGLWSPPLKDAQVVASVEVKSKGTEGISEVLTEHRTDTSVWMITESVTVGKAELGTDSNKGVDLDMTDMEKAHGSGAKAGPMDPDQRLEESCEALVLWSPSSGMMDMDQEKIPREYEKAILGGDESDKSDSSGGLMDGDTCQYYKASSIWPGVREALLEVKSRSQWVIGNGAKADLIRDNWLSSTSLQTSLELTLPQLKGFNAKVNSILVNNNWSIPPILQNMLDHR
ncbi:hypothetical protein IFM89_026675 [Coptis chinensis]|uniref:DUF4283 domain-containing protein n=1 Tax=Coptis chinensis TaxID=261450 RepID=A0A835M1T3_9MAGN|nr:hypothetical protein IFM89_026675 [Coptis chinensis]